MWVRTKPYRTIGSYKGIISVVLTAENQRTVVEIFTNKKPSGYLVKDFLYYRLGVWSRRAETYLNQNEARTLLERFRLRAF